MKIVDTHVHIWDLDRVDYPWLKGDKSILNNTWRIEQVEDERKEAGVSEGVMVQASGNLEDTELMLETATKTDWITGIVAWLPLTDPSRTEALLESRFLKEKYFKGVRHQIHDEKDPEWLLQPAVIKSLSLLAKHDIPFDVVAVLPMHIKTAMSVAEKVPGLRMIFDHLSQPPISSKERFGEWGVLMKEAATHKKFYGKISGLGTASGNFHGRTKEDIKPYIEFALTHFSPDRCMCGGDWPVSMLANNYQSTWQFYKNILSQLLSQGEQEKVLYLNAKSFYNLPAANTQ